LNELCENAAVNAVCQYPFAKELSETKKCVLIVLKFSGSCHAKYTAVFAPISIHTTEVSLLLSFVVVVYPPRE
jgi:hypothetical protein